ncbi:MAG: MbnP family copper-binding protein, partial [Myxococcota bacterium]
DDMVAQTLTFAVSVGDQDFTCGGTFSGLGSTGNGELTIVDARFYVHNVILIADDGTTEPLEMDDTGIWQTSGVALLDFEDGCGDGGSTEVNATITGMAPNKTYTGIEFTVGLPPELNSMDIVLEMRGSPLNITSMWWSWQSGYKFIRIDTMNDFRIHLGSAGCGEDFNCTAPNQPTFRIDGMDLATQTVTLDVAALVSGTDVTQNTDMTAPGCMSGAGDPECVGIFDALGLEYDGVASSGQKAFIAR